MTCNRCEKIGQETNTEPKSHCRCAYHAAMEEYIDQEAYDTERAIKTLQSEPSEKVKKFYDELFEKTKVTEIKR